MNSLKELPENPIIVLGMGSSGTRLIVRILEHCGVFMGGLLAENDFREPEVFFNDLNAFTDGFRYMLPLCPDWEDVVEKQQTRIRNYCVNELPSLYRNAGYRDGLWGFKDPRNVFTARLYVKIFPSARILHVIRDGIDVAETKVKQEWGNLPKNRNFEYWLKVWAQVVKVGRSLSELGPNTYCEVRYEDVCNHSDNGARAIANTIACDHEKVLNVIRALAHQKRVGKLKPRNLPSSLPKEAYSLRKQLGYASDGNI